MDIGFLGFAERAALVLDHAPSVFKWQVLGLKHILASPIFPLRLNGLYLGLGLTAKSAGEALSIRILDDSDTEVGRIDLASATMTAGEVAADFQDLESRGRGQPDSPILLLPRYGWSVAFLPMGDTTIALPKPGFYRLVLKSGVEEKVIGQIQGVLLNPPPLTPEIIAAIRSDPRAAKAIRLTLGCQHCESKLMVYAGLERLSRQEREGAVWYQDAPEVFKCGCGKTSTDLSHVRRNLFGLLGVHIGSDVEEDLVPMYEKSLILDIRTAFIHVLERAPNEETIQKFIQDHPIVLHQFPAKRIFWKPPLLTKYKADIGLLLPNRELLLVELEQSSLRLLKKDGGLAAPLQHAFDQIDTWLEIADEHRLAVLASLEILPADAGAVRGLVIAGRDRGNDAAHLRRLKSSDRGKVRFLTYDDLLEGLSALARRM